MKYYFYINDKIEEFDDLSSTKFKELNNQYCLINNNKMSQVLFNNMKLEYKYFKFIILDFNNANIDTKNKVNDIFEELLGNIETLDMRNKSIYFYFDNIDISFKDIIAVINDDFNANIVLYEGITINSKKVNNFIQFFNIYCDINFDNNYNCSSDLILKTIEDKKDIISLKNILLNEIDFETIQLIIALFNNNLNVTKTASCVYMHRNTINNKIEMIKNKTGLNVLKFNDAVAMYIMLQTK